MSDITRIRMSPAGRYYPAYQPPRLDDGTLDVRAYLADLDAHVNAGIDPTPRPPVPTRVGAR